MVEKVWKHDYKFLIRCCLWDRREREVSINKRVMNRSHSPVYLLMAVSWLEWDSRQPLSVSPRPSRPHWAQWNSGAKGRSHRVSPLVPATADTNTQGVSRPGSHTAHVNLTDTAKLQILQRHSRQYIVRTITVGIIKQYLCIEGTLACLLGIFGW